MRSFVFSGVVSILSGSLTTSPTVKAACASRATSPVLDTPTTTSSSAFTHPGLLHTEVDFTRVISYVETQAEPWYTGWLKLVSHANADYTPRPSATVWRGTGYPENYANLYQDAAAAYANAIYWKVTGNESHANATARILDAWSDELVLINGTSDKYLASGLYGYQLANAAEIIRDWSGWTGLLAFVDMLVGVFYSMNHDFLTKHNGAAIDHYWANWDLCNLCTMQAIGILSDNATMFNEAVSYFETGAGNGALANVIWTIYEDNDTFSVLGQGQEEGRDQGHSMLDYALLGVLGQQAYNQGIDLFGLMSNRILAGAEYVAKYNLNETVPYTTYINSDVTQSAIDSTSRGQIRPIWELLHAHYGVVKGVEDHWTLEFRDWETNQTGGGEGGGGDYGSTSTGYDQLGHGTLMYRLE